MKISVVMVAYDRNEQLKRTLKSYNLYQPKYSELEIVIVEEYKNKADSKMREGLKNVVSEFNNIKVIDDPFIGMYNPCKKLNMAASISTGDIILITNPENEHRGNIFSDVEKIFKYPARRWVVWACEHENGWHQHSIYAPHGWHYCAAARREVWNEIGGFDERYANGISWEDNDLTRTVYGKGIPIKQIDFPFTFHQRHSHTWGLTEEEIQKKIRLNQDKYREKWGDDKITNLKAGLCV